jgi:hypothetical protein
MLAIHKRFSVRRAGVLAVSVALLGAVVAPSSTGAWSTDDPTRAVVYQGKSGTDDGVMIASMDLIELVSTDSIGNIYSLLSTGGELAVGPGPVSTTIGDLASYRFVLTKTDVNGDLSWFREWGGTNFFPTNVHVAGDAVFVSGIVSTAVDVDPTAGSDLYSPIGADDAVVVQLDTNGNYVRKIAIVAQATKRVNVLSMATNSDGDLIVSGHLNGNTTFPGGVHTINATNFDGFIAQFDRSSGNAEWVAKLAGASTEAVYGVRVNPDGSLIVLGRLSGPSATLTDASGSTTALSNGSGSIATAVIRLGATGGASFAVVRDGSALNLVTLADNAALIQFHNGDLVRYDVAGAAAVVGSLAVRIDSMTRTVDGKLRLAGFFNSATDFDIGAGVDTRTVTNNLEGYLLTVTPDFRTESVQVFNGPTNSQLVGVVSVPDGGFVVAGLTTAGTMNLSNTIHPGTVTSSAGMTHMFFILRYDAAGTTGALPTAAPATTRYTTGNKKVTVRWSAVAGASSYTVTTSGGTVKCTSTTTSCEVTGLRNGKMYTYQVRSVNQAGVVSSEARTVRVIPGFRLKTTTFKVRRAPLLSSILTTPSKGAKRWRVTSGSCRISGSRLVMPSRAGSCRLQLSVAKRGSYPAMTTVVKITVTR